MRQSPAFSRRIREKCAALERFHPHNSTPHLAVRDAFNAASPQEEEDEK